MLKSSFEPGIHRIHSEGAVGVGSSLEALSRDIAYLCERVEEGRPGPRVVVLECGSGPFFVASPCSASDCDAAGPFWRQATSTVAGLAQPTVAVIEGEAIGPAWELALACDLRICTEDARVGSPEVAWGRMPAAGGTQRLARLVGPGRALWLLLRGEILSGAEALSLGLVQRSVPRSELSACVDDVLGRLRACAPIALAYTKEAAHSGLDLPLTDGMRLEADLASLLQTTGDRAEGIAAFRERRAPLFEGR